MKWYHRCDEFILKLDFVRNGYNNFVYVLKRNDKVILYLLLYVNDILMLISSKKEMDKLKYTLNGELEMKDHGEAERI